ncbi:MAG TPA: hypothetical protein VH877_16680 [Polyangia bacterium]|jgi:hypothetical protein|nr:hypothetical protein [Polyangia bacterium]
MISSTHPSASWFLLISSVFFFFIYAMPLFLFPLRWARWFAWNVPTGNTDLTVYFGRCLGGLALTALFMMLQAVPDPVTHRDAFTMVAWIGAFMTVVHIWGAARRAQPWTEDVEIGLYAMMTGLSLYFRSTLG